MQVKEFQIDRQAACGINGGRVTSEGGTPRRLPQNTARMVYGVGKHHMVAVLLDRSTSDCIAFRVAVV